jgi:hypothetical protein
MYLSYHVGETEDHTVRGAHGAGIEALRPPHGRRPIYSEFDGRPHLHMVAADWQEVAHAIDRWLDGAPHAATTQEEQTSG